MYSEDGYVHAQDTITVDDLKKNFGFSERQIAAMYSHFAWIIQRLEQMMGEDAYGKSYDPLSIDYENGVASSYMYTPFGRGFNFRDWGRVERMLQYAILEISSIGTNEVVSTMERLADEFK